MDEILKLLGAGSNSGNDDQQQYQDPQQGARNPYQSLPGGGETWEFESPDEGMDAWRAAQQQNSSVYNLPAPSSPRGHAQPNDDYGQNQGNDYEMDGQYQEEFSVPGGVPMSEIDIKESTVEGYMSSMNLPFEKADAGLWMLRYEGGAKDYEMFVELNSQDLRFVMPVLERVRDVCREKVWYHLLRLNYVTDNISFGINKRDEIFMVIEIPIRYISYEDFKRAFTYICTMMDEVYPELLFLAQKPTAVSTFQQSKEPT